MKTRRIKLLAIGNQNKFNYYIFEKKQKTVEKLFEIISKTFGGEFDFDLYKEEYQNEKGKWVSSKKINFEKITDSHESTYNDNTRIDIFFGNKKFFVSIYCSSKLREKFNEKLEEISVMTKEKKLSKKY